MATDKNPKPRKDDTPAKKAALPRRNKTGKKPHSDRRIRQLDIAALRTRRRVVPGVQSLSSASVTADESNPSGVKVVRDAKGYPSIQRKRYPRNPGAGPASVADMQARLRNNAPSIRKRKTSNYVKGRKPK